MGQLIERELNSGDEHHYSVRLNAGEVLQLRLEEKGIMGILSLADAADGRVVAWSALSPGHGRQTFTFIAERTGEYRLAVWGQHLAQPGGYGLTARVKDRANRADEARARAERLVTECFVDWNRRQTDAYEGIVNALEKTLPVWASLGATYEEGFTNNLIGLVYSDLGAHRMALPYFLRATVLCREADYKYGEISSLNNTGAMYSRLGLREEAVEHLKRAVQGCREVGDARGEGATLTNICALLVVAGEHREALEHYERALTLGRESGDKHLEGITLNSMGVVYSDLGENQKALELYRSALPLFEALGSKADQAVALNNIGKTLCDAGEYEAALGQMGQAVRLCQEAKNKHAEATAENLLGGIHWRLNDHTEALKHLAHALRLRRETDNVRGEALTLGNIGRLYLDMGRAEESLGYLQRALPFVAVAADKRVAATNLVVTGDAFYQLGRPRLAVFYLKLAVEALQELRRQVRALDKEIQRAFLRSVESIFRLLTERLIEQGRLSEAHQILNRFKDQTFFDYALKKSGDPSLSAAPGDIQFTPAEAAARAAYRASLQRFGDHTSRLIELGLQAQDRSLAADEEAERRRLAADSVEAAGEFRKVLDEIAAGLEQSSPTGQDALVQSSDTAEMQAALHEFNRQSGQRAVALYTLLGEEQYHLMLVTGDRLAVESVPVAGAELREKALAFWRLLSRSAEREPRPLAQELYELIFAPVEEAVRQEGAGTLLWALDGELRYIPMAALFDGRRYLAERFQNVIFTRAEGSRMTRPVSRRWSGWGFGCSKEYRVGDTLFEALSDVEAELRGIFKRAEGGGGIIEGAVLLNEDFNRRTLAQALAWRLPLVHIASHFNFAPGDEAGSFLLLGDGDTLTLSEMKEQAEMFEGVELLTLSACQTAAQQADSAGREVDGFAELAQRLGAGAVLASLWAVADDSTAQLMTDFYRKRELQGWSKAEALRQAQRSMIQGGDAAQASSYSHPHYWAPFVLFGNWQ